ncbi:glycoside hydrolase family 95 protein [Jiangella gansuensis]|uniref:glycoside hydrolase family 95 protein n=1 Tax=Jiangella gansuensis TaxID=281473 RepID=UPI0004B51107|nr:glycoside hydrolase family 95 protein [Jiangella gansuensis]
MIRRLRRRLSPAVVLVAVGVTASVGVAAVPPGSSAVPSGAGALAAAGSGATADDALTLWYDEPATSWESQTLPIGNGALGASVFGSVAAERLQFNEKTLWTGGPGSVQGYDFGNWTSPRPGAIEEVQDRIDAVQRVGAGWVAGRLGQARRGYGSYQTFGELQISQTTPPGDVSDYRRELDIAEAVAGVSYVGDGVRHTREYFASAAHDVIAARLAGDRPGAVDVTVAHTAPGNRTRQVTAADGRITVAGSLNDNAMRYEAQIQVLNDGGTRADNADGTVTVTDADAVVVVLGAGTDYSDTYPTYRGEDSHGAVTERVDAAAAVPYDELRAAHVADHAELFDRVALDLGQRMPDIPTDELLAQYGSDAAGAAQHRALEALFFQYGRYLLIASSRSGSLPANLQGVWNNSTAAPWGADYHVNINLQMNYWPAETTNLAETTEPLWDYIDALSVPGQVTAEQMFGNRGWVVMNETTPFGFTGVHDWASAFWFPEAAAWLAQHYYDHYRFTMDRQFLAERAYPIMKQLAQFWLDELRVDPRDGTLVVTPSYSPEHGDFTDGASMSQQIVWDLLTNVTEAAAVVGDDDTAFHSAVADTLEQLDPGTRIGSWGQLQEWKGDWDDPNDTHRHVSHLFGLHPGRQIAPHTTPELAEAAEVSLTARGDGGTGWSKAWKINFWARLLDGDHAHLMLAEQLQASAFLCAKPFLLRWPAVTQHDRSAGILLARFKDLELHAVTRNQGGLGKRQVGSDIEFPFVSCRSWGAS